MFALEATEVKEDHTVYRNVSYKEIMADYKPKWLAVVGLIASIFASL